MIPKIYLAAPFFSPEEVQNLERIELLCVKNKLEALSPRKFFMLPPKATMIERKMAFDSNLISINECDLVLACIDGYDAGTLWEMGFAFAIKRPVVAYTFKQRTMNLMLAQGCRGFLSNYHEIDKFLMGILKEGGYQAFETWDFNWEVAKEWMKKVR